MKFQLYFLLGTGLSCLSGLALGQCVVTEDCTALGYTENSCNGGKGVKCPFGSGWFCAEDEDTVCDKNGFKYTCTGTGYSGGSGQPCGGKYKTCNCATNYTWNGSSCTLSCSSSYQYTCTGTGYAGGTGSACGGKYTQCTCSSGYEWKNNSCQKQVLNGSVGNSYYCNGAIVGTKISGMNFFVATVDLGSMSWTQASEAVRKYSVCDNRWRLPSMEELEFIYEHKNEIQGNKISDACYWSSELGFGSTYYGFCMTSGGFDLNGNYHMVRPVISVY